VHRVRDRQVNVPVQDMMNDRTDTRYSDALWTEHLANGIQFYRNVNHPVRVKDDNRLICITDEINNVRFLTLGVI
jgi:hypothetical protein